MGEAHPPTVEEAKPTKTSHDQARGGRPKAVGAKAPNLMRPNRRAVQFERGVRCQAAERQGEDALLVAHQINGGLDLAGGAVPAFDLPLRSGLIGDHARRAGVIDGSNAGIFGRGSF